KNMSLRALRSLRFLLIVTVLGVSSHAQAPRQPATVFRSGTELVLVNVVVRDKSGAVVRGLTRDDFIIAEDDKPQTVTSFDFEELDTPSPAHDASASAAQAAVILSSPQRPIAGADASGSAKALAERADAAAKVDMRGRRLIVLFFDLSSMQPEEVQRAAK